MKRSRSSDKKNYQKEKSRVEDVLEMANRNR